MAGDRCTVSQMADVIMEGLEEYAQLAADDMKNLSDYDKKNTFDIEKYLSTNLILKPEDEVELYQM